LGKKQQRPRARRFTTPEGLASLERVLKAYAASDPEVNYCQVRAARPCRRSWLVGGRRSQGSPSQSMGALPEAQARRALARPGGGGGGALGAMRGEAVARAGTLPAAREARAGRAAVDVAGQRRHSAREGLRGCEVGRRRRPGPEGSRPRCRRRGSALWLRCLAASARPPGWRCAVQGGGPAAAAGAAEREGALNCAL